MPSAAQVIKEIPEEIDGGKVSVRDLMEQMNGRSLAFSIVLLALPNLVPFVNALGITQVTGVILVVFTIRLMMGIRKPWLPKFMMEFQTNKAKVQEISDKAYPYFKKLESFVKPRLRFLTQGRIKNFFYGLIMLALTIIMLLPLPFVNVMPAFIITIIALGLLQRDGFIAILGSALAIIFMIGLGYLLMAIGSELFSR